MDVVQFGTSTRDWLAGYTMLMSPMFDPVGDLAGKSSPKNPAPAGPNGRYTGRFNNAYFGPAEVIEADDGLELQLGPRPIRLTLHHWDGDTFAVAPLGENQPQGSLSSVSFSVTGGKAQSLHVQYLDDNGLGLWQR